jgi:hypothetical protein
VHMCVLVSVCVCVFTVTNDPKITTQRALPKSVLCACTCMYVFVCVCVCVCWFTSAHWR